jgi:hypothetical protein
MTRCALSGGLAALLAAVALTIAACSGTSPGQPTPSPRPSVAIAAIQAAAEALSSGGYTYRVSVKLRESGGAAAPITSLDLAFMRDSVALASLHEDRPLSDAANVVPAYATVDSRELTFTDSDPSHPAATSVVAKVSFSDGASGTNSAAGSADIPEPPPALYTLSGTVRDENSGRMLVGGTVDIVDGPDAGKSASTDAGGAYSLSGLAGGSFMVRATSRGYVPREQAVTLARDSTLDWTLRLIAASPPPSPAPPSPAPPAPSVPCAYSVAPTIPGGPDGRQANVRWDGGEVTLTVTRTSGTCAWQATTDVSWLTINTPSGNGSGT